MEVIRSSETSVHTRTTRSHITENGILQVVLTSVAVKASDIRNGRHTSFVSNEYTGRLNDTILFNDAISAAKAVSD
jgi:hypothetical protein